MKSHLISQVVLRNFSDHQKKVEVNAIKSGEVYQAQTIDIAYRSMDDELIEVLEKEWAKIESEAAQSIRVLQNGDLLYQLKHIRIIKELVVIHYLRTQVYLIAERPQVGPAFKEQVLKEVVTQHPEYTDLVQQILDREWPKKQEEAAVRSIVEYAPRINNFIEDVGLEVGEAPEGTEFILGDIPVLTISSSSEMGAINGVPITEARGVAMPITPHHIVSLKKNPITKKYITLTARQVAAVNQKQKNLAEEYYFSAPHSNNYKEKTP